MEKNWLIIGHGSGRDGYAMLKSFSELKQLLKRH